MKITIEFDNATTLVLAPEQLSLSQLTPENITLTVAAGTCAIPVVSFPGSLATAEEIAARKAAQEFAEIADKIKANGDGKVVIDIPEPPPATQQPGERWRR